MRLNLKNFFLFAIISAFAFLMSCEHENSKQEKLVREKLTELKAIKFSKEELREITESIYEVDEPNCDPINTAHFYVQVGPRFDETGNRLVTGDTIRLYGGSTSLDVDFWYDYYGGTMPSGMPLNLFGSSLDGLTTRVSGTGTADWVCSFCPEGEGDPMKIPYASRSTLYVSTPANTQTIWRVQYDIDWPQLDPYPYCSGPTDYYVLLDNTPNAAQWLVANNNTQDVFPWFQNAEFKLATSEPYPIAASFTIRITNNGTTPVRVYESTATSLSDPHTVVQPGGNFAFAVSTVQGEKLKFIYKKLFVEAPANISNLTAMPVRFEIFGINSPNTISTDNHVTFNVGNPPITGHTFNSKTIRTITTSWSAHPLFVSGDKYVVYAKNVSTGLIEQAAESTTTSATLQNLKGSTQYSVFVLLMKYVGGTVQYSRVGTPLTITTNTQTYSTTGNWTIESIAPSTINSTQAVTYTVRYTDANCPECNPANSGTVTIDDTNTYNNASINATAIQINNLGFRFPAALTTTKIAAGVEHFTITTIPYGTKSGRVVLTVQ